MAHCKVSQPQQLQATSYVQQAAPSQPSMTGVIGYSVTPLWTTNLSRKPATIFGQGTIPEPSSPHIGKGVATVAIVAQAAAFVYIYSPESISDSRNDHSLFTRSTQHNHGD